MEKTRSPYCPAALQFCHLFSNPTVRQWIARITYLPRAVRAGSIQSSYAISVECVWVFSFGYPHLTCSGLFCLLYSFLFFLCFQQCLKRWNRLPHSVESLVLLNSQSSCVHNNLAVRCHTTGQYFDGTLKTARTVSILLTFPFLQSLLAT